MTVTCRLSTFVWPLEIILWVRIVQVEVLHGVQYVLVLWIKETVQIEELYGSALILVLC